MNYFMMKKMKGFHLQKLLKHFCQELVPAKPAKRFSKFC